jgi:hypothetical protein
MHQEITFYRRCLNSYDEPYDSPLWIFRIPLSIPAVEALRYAREEFAKLCQISTWSDFAHFHRSRIVR